jgi:ABC-type Fe3+ transport system substrate-binding protein
VDGVARGQFSIGIGASDTFVAESVEKGLPIRQVPGAQMQEGTYFTAGPGSVMIPRNPPHPNALRVYLDYLLSQEGQTAWAKLVGFPSRRTDVPVDPPTEILVPKPGATHPATYKERFVNLRGEVLPFLQTVIPR